MSYPNPPGSWLSKLPFAILSSIASAALPKSVCLEKHFGTKPKVSGWPWANRSDNGYCMKDMAPLNLPRPTAWLWGLHWQARYSTSPTMPWYACYRWILLTFFRGNPHRKLCLTELCVVAKLPSQVWVGNLTKRRCSFFGVWVLARTLINSVCLSICFSIKVSWWGHSSSLAPSVLSKFFWNAFEFGSTSQKIKFSWIHFFGGMLPWKNKNNTLCRSFARPRPPDSFQW